MFQLLNVVEEAVAELLPYKELFTTEQSLVAAATTCFHVCCSFCYNFQTKFNSQVTNLIAKATNSIANKCQSNEIDC